LPPFFEHKHRIVWSHIENVNKIDEIQNNVARECLRFLDMERGIAITHDGDLPSRSGMGSSSAFTVGLLNALHHLTGKRIVGPYQLASEATHVEQDLIKDNVGNQDQIACAIGGLNRIDFLSNGTTEVNTLQISDERKKELESHLMMVFTGFPRTASEIAGTYDFNRDKELEIMKDCVEEGENILTGHRNITDFGLLLDEAWRTKKELSTAISTPYIDFLYDSALKAGAIGGKLLGAGGGGFMLLFCEPSLQEQVKEALKGLLVVPFEFENEGSKVLYQDD